MTIGTGIAILGVWGFASVCALSKWVTGTGFVIAIASAVVATMVLVAQ